MGGGAVAVSDGDEVARRRFLSQRGVANWPPLEAPAPRNYNVIMKSSLVQIGNWRGVRIPKAFLDRAGRRVVLEQIRAVDRVRLVMRLGKLSAVTSSEAPTVLGETLVGPLLLFGKIATFWYTTL